MKFQVVLPYQNGMGKWYYEDFELYLLYSASEL